MDRSLWRMRRLAGPCAFVLVLILSSIIYLYSLLLCIHGLIFLSFSFSFCFQEDLEFVDVFTRKRKERRASRKASTRIVVGSCLFFCLFVCLFVVRGRRSSQVKWVKQVVFNKVACFSGRK
jgi:hypothetical protein